MSSCPYLVAGGRLVVDVGRVRVRVLDVARVWVDDCRSLVRMRSIVDVCRVRVYNIASRVVRPVVDVRRVRAHFGALYGRDVS